MLGKHIKFRLFLVVIFVFVGAVIFLSDPSLNKTKNSPVYDVSGNVVSMVTNPNNVAIEDEEVAMGIPGSENSNPNWVLISIGVTLVNLGGAIGIVFMTSKETTQV